MASPRDPLDDPAIPPVVRSLNAYRARKSALGRRLEEKRTARTVAGGSRPATGNAAASYVEPPLTKAQEKGYLRLAGAILRDAGECDDSDTDPPTQEAEALDAPE